MILSFYSMQSIAMEDAGSEKSFVLDHASSPAISEQSVDVGHVIEVHPFMTSNVDQSLQKIKDNGVYGPGTDEDNPIIRDARIVFEEQVEKGFWIEGAWNDREKWKASTRCGLGLCTFLTGNVKEGKKLIVRAAYLDHSAWAHYYLGLIELVTKKKPNIAPALQHFKKAHENNPNHIPAHWYRHIMAMLGYRHSAPADLQPKDNWVTWADKCLVLEEKIELSYPLASCARTCRDEVGAEMMCLKVAAENKNVYQKAAIGRLCYCCFPQKNGAPHRYAREAEEILRDIGTRSEYREIQEAVRKLDEIKENERVLAGLKDLKTTAQWSGPNQKSAIRTLYKYSIAQEDGTRHPYAWEAEAILRDIGSYNRYHYLQEAIRMLNGSKQADHDDRE
jgi:hypothetical protein